MIINIGGERLKLDVPFDGQNEVRDAESKAAALFSDIRKLFPSRSDANVMAMVAFSLAEETLKLQKSEDEALLFAQKCEKTLTDALNF